MKTVNSGLIVVAFAGVLSLVLSARAPAALAAPPDAASCASEAEPLQSTPPPPIDCLRGCLKCQKECKGPDCDKFCVPQWAGCCVTEGKKPSPGMAVCGCQ
jgi:hypothetical protein